MIAMYANRAELLSEPEASLVADVLYQRRLIDAGEHSTSRTPSELAEVLRNSRVLGADLVSAILPVPGPVAQNALEKLLGRPIVHLPPQPSPPPAPPHEGARPVVQDFGPTGRRIITRIAPNPKRSGTGAYDRFALYREGMSVAEYLSAGGAVRDVSWDARQGYITLTDPGPAGRAAGAPVEAKVSQAA